MGGTTGTLISGFGKIIQSVEQTQKAIHDLNALQASGQISSSQNIIGQIGSYASLGASIFSFANTYIQGMIDDGKLKTLASIADFVAHSFQSSAQFSKQLNADITSIVTQVVGLPEDVLGRLGVNTTGSGAEYNDTLGIVREVVAEALKLPDIIKELGGLSVLTADQMQTVLDRTQYLFRIIAEGGALGAQAVQSLDSVLADMGNTAAANGGVVSQFFLDMVAHAQELGIVLPQVQQFLKDQASALGTGLSDLLQQPMIVSAAAVGKAVTDAQAALDTLKASGTSTASALATAQGVLTDALTTQHSEAERNQDALHNLGLEAVLAFNAAIASGSNFMQALHGISGALQTLQKAYKDLGLAADDPAIKGLLLEDTILNGTADKPSGLGTAISALQAIFTAAQNIPGIMNPDMFKAQQGNLGSLYTQTQAATEQAGGTTINALIPFQQTLHALQDYATKNNLQLDANTQQMIDQSKDLGIWSDDFKTDGEKTRDSIADLIASNDQLIVALGGTVSHPGGGSGSGGGAGGGVNDPGPIIDFPLPGGVHPGWKPGGDNDPTAPPIVPSGSVHGALSMAAGGFGFATSPMTFTTQGNEEYAFSGEGRRFSRADAPVASAATQTAGGDTVIVMVRAGNSASDAEIVDKAIAALPDRVRRNTSGLRSKLLGALGQPVTTWT